MGYNITWDVQGEHYFETGVDHCVLYVYDESAAAGKKYANGVAWNGITSVNEAPSGADANKMYADNIKYLNIYSAEEFGATIEAYTYPDEWAVCDGSAEPLTGMILGQQSRQMFGLCYRTKLGNDIHGDNLGYKLHLVYGCMASPSSRGYQSTNESPDAITFSWEINTTPVEVPVLVAGKEYKPTAIITLDSTKFTDSTSLEKWNALLTKLYGSTTGGGTGGDEPVPGYLPLPSEVFTTLGGTLPSANS